MKKTPIKVIIRIKPGSSHLIHDNSSITLTRTTGETSTYEFDHVLGPKSTQAQVYKTVRPVIEEFKCGLNCTLFCYGNTGAGKTYTMLGGKQKGLVYRIASDLLSKPHTFTTLKLSVLEIYNEKIYDLLNSNSEITLREDGNRNIVLPNLVAIPINTEEEFASVVTQGLEGRTLGKTNLNEHSSRSHTLIRILGIFEKRGVQIEAKLNLIDLAGSEDNRRTGNVGVRLVESGCINKSLFTLAKVVNSILKGETRIPYRDSKLTRLLQDSMGGGSMCYLIANVCDEPEMEGETSNTLKFAAKSRKIINRCVNLVEEANSLPTPQSFNKGVLKEKSINKRRNKIEETALFKNEISLSPTTKQKNYLAFMRRAQKYEALGKTKLALADYQTLLKFTSDKQIEEKIKELRKTKTKRSHTTKEILEILNSGNFIEIKELRNVGDKRAEKIINYTKSGGRFKGVEELFNLFSRKIVNSIINNSSD